jgi:putative glutamine transport system permease protein
MDAVWDALMELLPGNWEWAKDWVYWEFLFRGLRTAFVIGFWAILLSIVVGTIMAVGRLAPSPLLRWLAGTYVEVFRATPLLLLIFFVFYGAGRFNTGWARDIPVLELLVDDRSGDLTPIAAAILALALYNSAVVAEIVRAGILSISSGILEAGRALGLRYLQTMRYVAIPMALRRMAPGLVSQLITLFKDTSLVAQIAVFELLRRGKILYESTALGNPTIEVLTVVALMYFVPSYLLSLLAARLERGPERGREPLPAAAGEGTGA